MLTTSECTVEPTTGLQEKFMRLLELDRNSPEFEELFREVDAELDTCVRMEEAVSVS